MTKLNKYLSDSYKNFFDKDLSITDPELYKSLKLELQRQQQHIELIASENIVSKAVLDAQGSIMTNKYAEGYSSKRYYGGCEFVDIAEDLALERVKKSTVVSGNSTFRARTSSGLGPGGRTTCMRAVNRQPWFPREGLVETAAHTTGTPLQHANKHSHV